MEEHELNPVLLVDPFVSLSDEYEFIRKVLDVEMSSMIIMCVLSPSVLYLCCLQYSTNIAQGLDDDKRNVRNAVEMIYSGDARMRDDGLEVLRDMGPRAGSAVPDLIRLLESKDLWLSENAIYVLLAIGPQAKAALPELSKLAIAPGRDRRRLGAAEALWRIGKHETAVPVLAELLSSDGVIGTRGPLIQDLAARLLMEIGPDAKGALPQLRKAVDSKRGSSRLYVIRAHWRIGRQADVVLPAMIELLTDGDESVRWLTMSTIEEIGAAAKVAVPTLGYCLSIEKKGSLRRKAALALGEIGLGAREAIPILARALDDDVQEVRDAASKALKRIQE